MNRLASAGPTKQRAQFSTPALVEGTSAEPLEVNVIFTELEATAAALKAAESFARALGAQIRLRAALVVPLQLPLDRPQVSVEFLEQALRDLVNRTTAGQLECTAHLYICRDSVDTLSEVVKPDSIVVIGVRKRWWPTATTRLARAFRANHGRVIVIGADGPRNRPGKHVERGERDWPPQRNSRSRIFPAWRWLAGRGRTAAER